MYSIHHWKEFDGNLPKVPNHDRALADERANCTLPWAGRDCLIVRVGGATDVPRAGRFVVYQNEYVWSIDDVPYTPQKGDMWAYVNVKLHDDTDWNELKNALYYRIVGHGRLEGGLNHFCIDFTADMLNPNYDIINDAKATSVKIIETFIENLKELRKNCE